MEMWSRNRKWILLAVLVALGIVCLSTATEARRRFRWWFRPPAPAIENSDYVGEAAGRVRSVSVLDGAISSDSRTSLEGVEFTARVVDGVLTIDPISATSSSSDDTTTTTTVVDIALTDTELIRTYFYSLFYAEGEATVTVTVEESDDSDPPVVTTTETTTVVPVRVFGNIHGHNDGEFYHLRGGIRGFLREENEETGEITYTLIGVRLNGEGIPVVEEEEEEIPLPE